MQYGPTARPARRGRRHLIPCALAAIVAWGTPAARAQEGPPPAGPRPPAARPGVPGRGVLGDVPLTAADSAV
jgi:hypothetical protein